MAREIVRYELWQLECLWCKQYQVHSIVEHKLSDVFEILGALINLDEDLCRRLDALNPEGTELDTYLRCHATNGVMNIAECLECGTQRFLDVKDFLKSKNQIS